MSRWESDLAIYNYNKLTRSLGLPDWLAPQEGGKAAWRKDKLHAQHLCFCEIIIEDDAVPHKKYHQEYHCDTLLVAIEVAIPYCYQPKLLSVCRSLIYDRQKQKLMSRGASFGECIVALRLALETIYRNHPYRHLAMAQHAFSHEAESEEGFKEQYLRLWFLLKTTQHYFPLETPCEKKCDYSRIDLVEQDEIAAMREAMEHTQVKLECKLTENKSHRDQ